MKRSQAPLPHRTTWSPTRRAAGLMASAIGLVAAFVLGPAGVVAAHSDDGLLTVMGVEQPPGSPGMRTVGVNLTYAGDGHPADAATVTISGTGPDGAEITPVAMTPRGRGNYLGEVATDEVGTWTLSVVSVDPSAETDLSPIEVTDDELAGGSGQDEGSSQGDSDGNSEVAGAEDPVETGYSGDGSTDDAENSATSGEAESDDSGVPPVVWVVLAVAVLAVAGVAVFAVRRRSAEP